MKKQNNLLTVAALLLCLTLLSTALVSGMLAKYAVGGGRGDGARVAGFGSLTLEESTGSVYQLIPGVPIPKDPTVSMSASEVAVRVTVKLELGRAWQSEDHRTFTALGDFLTFHIAQGWNHLEGTTFYRDLPPGTGLDKAPLIENGQILVSGSVAYDSFYSLSAEDVQISITAVARQID